jgi:hypothetical protein
LPQINLCNGTVGRAYAKLLKAAGIITARELRDADRRWIRRRMTVVGARIVAELRGVRCFALEQCPQQKKSVTCSRSFGVFVESLDELREAVAVYTTGPGHDTGQCSMKGVSQGKPSPLPAVSILLCDDQPSTCP